MQTKEMLETIFKHLIGRADMRDLYALADPTTCKEYIVMTEKVLKKLFKRFHLSRKEDGELLIQSIKGFQSVTDEERGGQDMRCKELAFFFIKIFQIYAALTISIIDSKMPDVDPEVRVAGTGPSRKEYQYIKPGEEGLKGFVQQPQGSWLSWMGVQRGGGLPVESPFFIKAPQYKFLNAFFDPKTLRVGTHHPGDFITPDQNYFRQYNGFLTFSYDSLYEGAVRDVGGQQTFERDSITSVDIQFSKDERRLMAKLIFQPIDANNTNIQFEGKVQLEMVNANPKEVNLSGLTVATAGPILQRITSQPVPPGATFPDQFQSFLSSALDEHMPLEFSIGEFLLNYNIINTIDRGVQVPKVAFIKAVTDSSIAALNVDTAAKTNKVALEFKTVIKVEKTTRMLHIYMAMIVDMKKNKSFNIKLEVNKYKLGEKDGDLRGYVNPKEYASGFKEKDFTGVGGRLVASDGTTLQAFVERTFKSMIVTDESYQTDGGIEYTKNTDLPIPKNTARMPQSMKIKDLWSMLAKRPYIKAYAIALGSSLLNVAGLKGDPLKPAYSDICRTRFPYATDGSLPAIGSSITSSYGLKALSTLFIESVEGGMPQLKDNEKFQEFRKSLKRYFEFKADAATPESLDAIKRLQIEPCVGHENDRIKLDNSGIIGKLRFQVNKLIRLQESHIENAMGLLFQLFDQPSVTRGEFKTSLFVQQGGMEAVELVGRRARDVLMNYYLECERIYMDALKDIHAYVKANEKNPVKIFDRKD